MNLKRACQGSPQWLRRGTVLSGNQEPLAFRVRKGGVVAEHLEKYEEEHTEERVKSLAAAGVTLFITHLYKGFGLEAEREEIAKAIEVSNLCHKYGIKVGVYVGDTIILDTFLHEVPEAREWVQRTADGRYIYYGDQTFRYRVCRSRPEYIEYLKDVVKVGIEEVGADLIHFDNWMHREEPDACHCPACEGRFREYLREKYTPLELKRRLGYSKLEYVVPPVFRSKCKSPIDDPLKQEWIDFRCDILAETYGEMARYIRELNPQVAVECNPTGSMKIHDYYKRGVSLDRLLPHGDLFWTEETNHPKLTPDGHIIGKFRTFKIGKTLGNRVLTHHLGGVTPLDVAEALAFNGNFAFGAASSISHYVNFYKENIDLYLDTDSMAKVAVLHSFPSLAYGDEETHRSVMLIEQVLFQRKIPFDIIFDGHLREGVLSKYSALVLANVQCMGHEECNIIEEYVRSGGGLLMTEGTSSYNQWRWRLKVPGLDHVTGGSAGRAKRCLTDYGAGRVAYIPKIISRAQETSAPYWAILPVNDAEIADAIFWVTSGEVGIRVLAPDSVGIELAKMSNGDVLLHMVNYNAVEPASGIVVEVELHGRVTHVTLMSPDAPGRSVEHKVEGHILKFIINEVITYSVARITIDAE